MKMEDILRIEEILSKEREKADARLREALAAADYGWVGRELEVVAQIAATNAALEREAERADPEVCRPLLEASPGDGERLSTTEEFILLAIRHDRGGENYAAQIAVTLYHTCKLDIWESGVRKALYRMESKGLVRRRSETGQFAAAVWWSLTEQGEGALDAQVAARRALTGRVG